MIVKKMSVIPPRRKMLTPGFCHAILSADWSHTGRRMGLRTGIRSIKMSRSKHRPERIIIVAMTAKRVIGHKGAIPWHIPDELRLFRELTEGQSVIMGRRTFESIGQPLPNRHNIVVSSRLCSLPGVDVCRNLETALQQGDHYEKKIFLIGGVEIYRAALPLADFLYISWIDGDFEGDTWFPDFSFDQWEMIAQRDLISFRHEVYRRRQ
ncbi:MAG: dihydrofolate reductase [Syntrophotaleaceae bacterium]